MTPERDVCDRARQALEGVTDGPWEATSYGVEQPYEFDLHRFDQMPLRIARTDQSGADSKFIAAARTLVPELVAEVERLRANQRVETVEDWHGKCKGGN